MSDEWEKELKRLEERMAKRGAEMREQDQENSNALREAEERRKAAERGDCDKPAEGGESDKPVE